MNLIFKWLNNFLFTSNIRPESSSYRFTDSKKNGVNICLPILSMDYSWKWLISAYSRFFVLLCYNNDKFKMYILRR